jgi:hypothetical protein
VENVASAIGPGGARPVAIADVRDVPLHWLPGDVDCDDLVSRVLGRQRIAVRVDVAMFNSAI